jgi:phosphate transport system substrate-binding protein
MPQFYSHRFILGIIMSLELTLLPLLIKAIIPTMKRNLLLWLIMLVLFSACKPSNSPNELNSAKNSNNYIENKGSDTIVNLALAWAEQYQTLHPEISISVTGGGTGTGIAALINKTVDIANASRKIKPEEIQAAKDNGVDPVEFVISRDAIAIVVNPENPIDQLTIQQISDIYSGKINNWSEVGGEDRPIVRLSRETNSGTHVYFLENVLRLGEKDNKTLFSTDTLLLPSSQGITTETSQNPNTIGYDGLGYVTPELKVIAVAVDPKGPYVIPSADTVNEGTYPIARDLYMYTDGQPTSVKKAYIDWIRSAEGQKIVKDLGFVPITYNP